MQDAVSRPLPGGKSRGGDQGGPARVRLWDGGFCRHRSRHGIGGLGSIVRSGSEGVPSILTILVDILVEGGRETCSVDGIAGDGLVAMVVVFNLRRSQLKFN